MSVQLDNVRKQYVSPDGGAVPVIDVEEFGLDDGEHAVCGGPGQLQRHGLILAIPVGEGHGYLPGFRLDEPLGKRPDFVGRFGLTRMNLHRSQFRFRDLAIRNLDRLMAGAKFHGLRFTHIQTGAAVGREVGNTSVDISDGGRIGGEQ